MTEHSEIVLGPSRVMTTPTGLDGEWYLFNWNTDPAYQGQGYGAAVMTALCTLCDRQHRTLTTHPESPRLVETFARFGFEDVGDPDLGWEGHPLMIRLPR